MLLGSARAKAASKMLMKLTPGVLLGNLRKWAIDEYLTYLKNQKHKHCVIKLHSKI